MGITIKVMEDGDLRAVWALVKSNPPEYPPPSWPTTMLELQRAAFLHPRARPEGRAVAESDGRPVGCLVFHYYPEEGSATIVVVAVDAGYQRTGLGLTLLEVWEARARDLGAMRLWAPEAPEEDERLLALTAKFGMRRVGTIRSWVRGDEAAPKPEDDPCILPLVNVQLAEVTAAFNECFPQYPRTPEDLYAYITQTRWGPWASLAYVENNRVVAFLFTTDRGGRPYLQHIGTRPEARRRHLAFRLLQNALFILRQGGAREVECEVPEGNDQAAKLAAAVGLRPGRRRIALTKDLV